MTKPVNASPDLSEFDRFLVVSRQPEALKAARQVARWVASGLARPKKRDGWLIAQIDELLGDDSRLVSDVPFLPSEAVAACFTGSPYLVGSVLFGIAKASQGQAVIVHPVDHAKSLRVAAAAHGGTLLLNQDGYLGGHSENLKTAAWDVRALSAEEFQVSAELQAWALLNQFAGQAPAPWQPPSTPSEPAPEKKKTGRLNAIRKRYGRPPRRK